MANCVHGFKMLLFHLAFLIAGAVCSEIVVSDIEAKDAVGNPTYIGTVMALGSVACVIILLIGCAGLCPRRSPHKAYDNGPDSYFNDITIGRPPAPDFAMYPPVESAPAITTSSVYFEPLPDPAKLNQQRQAGTPSHYSVSNASRLRPKILPAVLEDVDNENDCDIADSQISQRRVALQDKIKLGRLLTNIQKVNAKNQFPRSQLQYIRELGFGWFGKVLQGEGNGILPGHKKTKVVIQMLNDECGENEQYSFLMEGTSYREIDSPNVLKLLGQCIETTPYLCILELCALGDLKSYLRSQRSSVDLLDKKGLLLNFACDMAAGLQALHQAGFVHRDFASRNCLVTADKIVKVGDYGLSEEVFKDDYYFDGDSSCAVPMPIRWLAPESVLIDGDVIALKKITKESNLWSFGVALWEVFTCGSMPYGDLSNNNVLRLVINEGSVLLPKPDLSLSNVERLYQLMKMCWHVVPGQRASLRELRIMLLHLRSAVHDDPDDSADFDQKWNQLMPRRVAAAGHVEPRATTVDVHAVSPDTAIDVDLGTLSGANKPMVFKSDSGASGDARKAPLWSESSVGAAVPDVAVQQQQQHHVVVASSPINEMSLAAELGVFDTTFGLPDGGGDADEMMSGFRTTVTYEDDAEEMPQHFDIRAEVHSENVYATEYEDNSFGEPNPASDGKTKAGLVRDKPSLGNDVVEAGTDEEEHRLDDEFSSFSQRPAATMYSSYLQTVPTSMDFDDLQSIVEVKDQVVNDAGEFAHYYRSLAEDANGMAAGESFLGDNTEFGKYYDQLNGAGKPTADHQDATTA